MYLEVAKECGRQTRKQNLETTQKAVRLTSLTSEATKTNLMLYQNLKMNKMTMTLLIRVVVDKVLLLSCHKQELINMAEKNLSFQMSRLSVADKHRTKELDQMSFSKQKLITSLANNLMTVAPDLMKDHLRMNKINQQITKSMKSFMFLLRL